MDDRQNYLATAEKKNQQDSPGLASKTLQL